MKHKKFNLCLKKETRFFKYLKIESYINNGHGNFYKI